MNTRAQSISFVARMNATAPGARWPRHRRPEAATTWLQSTANQVPHPSHALPVFAKARRHTSTTLSSWRRSSSTSRLRLATRHRRLTIAGSTTAITGPSGQPGTFSRRSVAWSTPHHDTVPGATFGAGICARVIDGMPFEMPPYRLAYERYELPSRSSDASAKRRAQTRPGPRQPRLQSRPAFWPLLPAHATAKAILRSGVWQSRNRHRDDMRLLDKLRVWFEQPSLTPRTWTRPSVAYRRDAFGFT